MQYINHLSVKNGTLIIKVKSAVVRNELSYQKSKIQKIETEGKNSDV